MAEMGLELGAPIGVSGAFLHDQRRFAEIHAAAAKLNELGSRLEGIEYKLRCCNDPGWLSSFEKNCKRLKWDARFKLVELVAGLETQKSAVVSEQAETHKKLLALEPTALKTYRTLVGACPQPQPSLKSPAEKNTAVQLRNKAIDCLIGFANNRVICQRLDEEFPPTRDRPAPQFPNAWFERFAVKSFVDAYRKCPHLVHTMIWRRNRLQSP